MFLVFEIFDCVGVCFDWQWVYVLVGFEDVEQLFENVVDVVKKCGIGLKIKLFLFKCKKCKLGMSFLGLGNLNVQLWLQLGFYVGVCLIKVMKGLLMCYLDFDLILICENIEDIYKGIEYEIVFGVVQSYKVVMCDVCECIVCYVFCIVCEYGCEYVIFIYKGNIMKKLDGFFMQIVCGVVEDNSDVGYCEMIVDVVCMYMVFDFYQFDVILMGNFYGDIFSSFGFGFVGGILLVYLINFGDDYCIFEVIYGDVEYLVGIGKVNLLLLLFLVVVLVCYFNEYDIVNCIEVVVLSVFEKCEYVMLDFGGMVSLCQMCNVIIEVFEGDELECVLVN